MITSTGATIYDAAAAGTAADGIDMGIGISNQNGLSFGELHVTGLTFGLEADEFAAYLFGGGGLELQQEFCDQHFDSRLIVLPFAITTTQGGGWFPEPLPNPALDPGMDDEAAMAALCSKPWNLRWPDGLLRILRRTSDHFLDAKANTLSAAGDRGYRRVLDHIRHQAESQAVHADFGDLNQGRSGIPASPKP